MKHKSILLLGDSITESFNTQKLLLEFKIINKGISGNNSTHLLKRLDRDLVASNPDIVCMLIGTNDIANGFSDEKILSNISSIIELTMTKLNDSKIFITSILPTRDNQPRPNERIQGLNKQVQIIAKELNVNYLNLYFLFVDETRQLIFNLTEDGLHLNNRANFIWANILRKLLEEKLGGGIKLKLRRYDSDDL